MADVAIAPGMREQVWLVAGLRWRIFRNALRSMSAKLDLLGLILSSVMGGIFVLSVGFGLGVASYTLVAHGRPGYLALPMLAVFLFWQFVPVLLATSGSAFDFRNLLRFPLRFPVFFALSLAYGLSDPAAVGSLIWLACIAWGIGLARLELLPVALLVLSVYAAMNLLLNRAIFTWLERLLARRRAREAFLAVFLLALFSFQLFVAVGTRWQKRFEPYVVAAMPLLKLLPPGLAGKALDGAALGKISDLGFSVFLLLVYSLGFVLLLERRLHAQFLGEDLGETQAPIAVARAAPLAAAPSASLVSRLLPGRVAALLEKEVRYLTRNTAVMLSLLVPLILILFFAVTWSTPRQRGQSPFPRWPELVFPGAVAYMLIIVTPFAHNSFAFEGKGVQLLFVAPIRLRDVLLAKNLTLGLVLILETALVWLEVALLKGPPSALAVTSTLLALAFFMLAHFLVGNWLSLQFPRRFEFGQFKRRVSGATMFIGLVAQLVLLGLAALILLVARVLGQMWMVPVIFLVLSATSLAAYVSTLDTFDRFADSRREALLTELCR